MDRLPTRTVLGVLAIVTLAAAAALVPGAGAAPTATGAGRQFVHLNDPEQHPLIAPQPVPGGDGASASETLTRYIVFEAGPGGLIRPLQHRLVRLAAPLKSLDHETATALLALSNRNSEPLLVRLKNKSGEVVFRGVVAVPRWLRGEFHGEEGSSMEPVIDGHLFPLETATFAVRVPAIPDVILHLERAQSQAAASFDLAAMEADPLLQPPDLGAEQVRLSDPPPGEPGNRVDLLIMGDGYTAAESAQFDADAAAAADDFFGITPYAEYRNYVNVHTLFTASNESGADHPPYDPACSPVDPTCCGSTEMQSDPLAGTFVDTAFDARYCAMNIHRLLVVDSLKVLNAAAAVPDWDRILVLVNDATYGGSGGYLSVVAMHASAAEIAQHEHGHSFTDLADEYESAYPGYPPCSDIGAGGPSCEVNVTNETERALIKWSPWILPDTPLPTSETDPLYADLVGLFEGARYQSTGMYRSGQECLMRSLGRPFCQVPSQAYVLKLYDGGWGVPALGIDAIEPGTEDPPPGSVWRLFPESVTFSVGLLEPVGGPPLEVAWYVNGVRDPSAQSDSYTFVPDETGIFEIRLETTDATTLVHPAMAGASLQSSRVWNLTVSDGTPTATDTPTATPTPTKQPFPGDTDGDGCPDADENGPDETLGGRRDYKNPWDYFNPTNDGQNRVDDILVVLDHYFLAAGQPGYDEKYDRSAIPETSTQPWRLGPPGGQVLVDDILHIVNSYFHDCGTGVVKPTPTPTP